MYCASALMVVQVLFKLLVRKLIDFDVSELLFETVKVQ